MLDKRDFSPVGYKRYSKKSGKEVEWNDVVKGYEYDKDQYVVLSDEDFRRANVKASQTIEIEAFVPAGEIPPQYLRDAVLPRTDGARREGLCAAARDAALDRPCGNRASRHSHDAAPRAGRCRRTSADAHHDALPGRAALPKDCRCRPRASRARTSRPRKSSSPSGWSTTWRSTGSPPSSRTRITRT